MMPRFARNQASIRNWLKRGEFDGAVQATASSLARHLSLSLINLPALDFKADDSMGHRDPSGEEVDELWNRNEYFSQCLTEISEDILFYVYSFSWKTRVFQPKCLLGHYELVKNLVHMAEIDGTISLPRPLKEFLEERMIRVLFIDCTISAIKTGLTKLSDSIHTQSFIKELAALIEWRLQQFQDLFGLGFAPKAREQLVASFVRELESKDETLLEIPVDYLLMCICFSSYKALKEKVLFAKVITLYEENFEALVNRAELLKFYNEVFLLQNSFHSQAYARGGL